MMQMDLACLRNSIGEIDSNIVVAMRYQSMLTLPFFYLRDNRITKIAKLGFGYQGLRSGVDRASQKKIEIAPTSIKVATQGVFEASDPDPGEGEVINRASYMIIYGHRWWFVMINEAREFDDCLELQVKTLKVLAINVSK